MRTGSVSRMLTITRLWCGNVSNALILGNNEQTFEQLVEIPLDENARFDITSEYPNIAWRASTTTIQVDRLILEADLSARSQDIVFRAAEWNPFGGFQEWNTTAMEYDTTNSNTTAAVKFDIANLDNDFIISNADIDILTPK